MIVSEITEYRQRIVACAESLVRAGILSNSFHGNISALLPGQQGLLLTSRSTLAELRTDEIARLSRVGELLEGRIDPASHEIIRMHTVVYEHRPEVRAVIHTHSSYASAFAIAGRELPCVSEVQARFLGPAPVPVARFAPRGSKEAVENIAAALDANPQSHALLLEHHGVLTFGESLEQTTRLALALEEGAELAWLASALGPLRPMPEAAAASAQERRLAFEQIGGLSAGGDSAQLPASY